MQQWQPHSWQQFAAEQQVKYESADTLKTALDQLTQYPPLVTVNEVEQLRVQLASAAKGERFILQGGDCAEGFSDCREETIKVKLKILLQMSLILLHGMRLPITRIGRIAGQYAKPRSADTETKDNITLASYRGDIVNAPEFTENARKPDPKRLIQGYHTAATTLNYIRALLDSGFANLHHPEQWDIDFVQHSPKSSDYHQVVDSIQDTLAFIKTIDGLTSNNLNRVDFFTSHEALHLPFEQALTRQTANGQWYNLSTHFPWLGKRTANIGSAHLEYFRGIANPIGVKVGPEATADWLKSIITTLNPNNIPGKLTLITRLGAKQVSDLLPDIIKTVNKLGIEVVWSCDPMHGNTQTAQGYKTRDFNHILHDLNQTFLIHQQHGSILGGVHFELTGENVTECIGGARGLNAEDLKHAYKTLVDPRLNYEQSLEMAMLIVEQHQSL